MIDCHKVLQTFFPLHYSLTHSLTRSLARTSRPCTYPSFIQTYSFLSLRCILLLAVLGLSRPLRYVFCFWFSGFYFMVFPWTSQCLRCQYRRLRYIHGRENRPLFVHSVPVLGYAVSCSGPLRRTIESCTCRPSLGVALACVQDLFFSLDKGEGKRETLLPIRYLVWLLKFCFAFSLLFFHYLHLNSPRVFISDTRTNRRNVPLRKSALTDQVT